MGRNEKSRIIASLGILLTVVLVAAGCGSDGGPEDALDAFADAINDRDEDAVLELTCEASHENISATLSDPFQNTPTGVDAYEVEPRLRDVRYQADAGNIVEQNDTEATGQLKITVQGVPENLSPEAQQIMDSVQIAFPLTLIDAKDQTVELVKEGDAWVACG